MNGWISDQNFKTVVEPIISDIFPIFETENYCHFNGSDTRERVTQTNIFPYSAVVNLIMKWGNEYSSCSGIVIRPSWALTAGHCIYDTDTDAWADDVIVIPALDGTTKPYGQTYATNLISFNGWTSSHSYDWDMGWIKLASPIGSTVGTISMKVYSDSALTGSLNTAGYPYDYNDGTWMAADYRSIYSVSSQLVCSELSTCSGQSGSGAWFYLKSGERYITSIISGSGGTICGNHARLTRISQGKYDTICDDVPCVCVCTSGSCCDGCSYLSSTEICNNNQDLEYGCEGNICGTNARKRVQVQYCSGSSSSCNGLKEWQSWQVIEKCNSNQICKKDGSTNAKCETCSDGCEYGMCKVAGGGCSISKI